MGLALQPTPRSSHRAVACAVFLVPQPLSEAYQRWGRASGCCVSWHIHPLVPLCVCIRACLLACLLQDALDNVWKAHQTLGGEPYPQARMQHLLIVFGTLLVRFMQVG